jgi:uncharacterized protein YukE
MPEPHPNLHFDKASAEQVVLRARELIQLLDQQTTLRRQNADLLRPTWQGYYARRFFETELPRMQQQAAGLVAELQQLIHRVESAGETAAGWARENQRYREREGR